MDKWNPEHYLIAIYCYGRHDDKSFGAQPVDSQRLYCHTIKVFEKIEKCVTGVIMYSKEMNKTYLIPPTAFESYFVPYNYNYLWSQIND